MLKGALNQYAKTERHKKAIRAYKSSNSICTFFSPE